MKYLKSFKIFEKTTLINIGVPYDVMQTIQRNYTISDNAKWTELKYKKEIKLLLSKKENNLIISISNNKILVVYYFDNKYFMENYDLIENDDFGNIRWERIYRVETTITEILNNINKDFKSYKLTSGEWSTDFATERKLKRETKKFDKTTEQFKKDFAKNFTKIVKRLYGRRSNMVSDTIIDYLKNVSDDSSESKIREILFMNVDKAKEVEYFRKRGAEKDPYKLYSDRVKADSLTIFDDYILLFEDYYSNKYKEFLNIPEMIDRWSRDKVMTAFMVYLYNGILMEL